MSQIAGVRQAGKNVFPRQPRILCQKLALALACRKEVKNKFNCQTCSPDYWFASQNLRIQDDTF